MTSVRELKASRELLANLTMREVKGKYKRSLLGQAWSLLNPVATLTIYSLVFGFVLKQQPLPGNPSGLEVFALWLACALLPWNFFNNTVQGGMSALVSNANLIQKVYFPRYTLIVSSMMASLVTLGFELLVLLAAIVVFGGNPWLWIPGVLVMVALLALFGLGIGLMLSIANVYFRDTAQFVGIFMQIWFYATPIVYPPEIITAKQNEWTAAGRSFPLEFVYGLNPLERFVTVFRNLFYDNRWPDFNDFAYCVGAAAVSMALGIWVFTKFEGKIAEEL